MKKTTLLTVLILGIFSFVFAHGQDCEMGEKACKKEGMNHPMMQQKNMANHFMMMRKELDLTDKQVKQMEQNRLDTEKEIALLEAQLKIAQMEHHATMKNHEYSKAKTHSDKMLETKKQIAAKRIDLKEKNWNQLTKEQQKKWDELKLEHPVPRNHDEQMMKHPRKMK
jgi:Spy/CpxP family protein refolding chaperone